MERIEHRIFPSIISPLDHRCSFFVAAAFVAVLGCGRTGPPRAPVVGTVRYQGQSVVGANVAFMPVEKSARGATGTTDAQGNYRLETLGLGEGAIVGKHLVCVGLRATPTIDPNDSKPPPMMQRRKLGKPLIPLKYFTPEKSGLTADVADVNENRFDFDLTP